MRKILLVVFIFGFSINALSQTISDNKKKKIEQLLEISGSAKNGILVINTLMDMYKKRYPDVEQRIWDNFSKEFNEKDLIELVIPIYDKYFTENDIDQYIAFYKTAAGQKMVDNLPKITQEGMIVGQEWGKQITQKIAQKLKSEGY